MTIQDVIGTEWIDWAKPTPADADEFFQVEIRLSRQTGLSAQTTMAFWGNVGLGTPWRRTWRWRSSHSLAQELAELAMKQPESPAKDVDPEIRERAQRLMDLGDGDEAGLSMPVVRTYRSLTRAWHPHRGVWLLDAIADDGTAWCAQADDLALNGSNAWWPHQPLPQPDQPDQLDD